MQPIDHFEAYEHALEQAKTSPCKRRKYGAIILTETENGKVDWTCGVNLRVSDCCNGDICVRDRYATSNGERAELGAEIHAEQSALVLRRPAGRDIAFILAGLDKYGKELTMPSVFPCHVCALMIAHAGFKYVWMLFEPGVVEPISIYDIIEHREAGWSNEVPL